MKIVRRPADQVCGRDISGGRNGLVMDLECAIILRGVDVAGLTATWIGLW